MYLLYPLCKHKEKAITPPSQSVFYLTDIQELGIGIFKNKLVIINTNSLTNTSKEHIL